MSKTPKIVSDNNVETDPDIVARKAEIFDIQVGQDTLKVKWDELEKHKSQRLNDLKEVLQSKYKQEAEPSME